MGILDVPITERIALAMRGGIGGSRSPVQVPLVEVPELRSERRLDVAAPWLLSLVLLAFWIGLEPFHDRSGKETLGTLGAGNLLNQVAYPLIAILTVSYVAWTRPQHFQTLFAPVYMVFVGWMLIIALKSGDVGTALRRLIFELVCVSIAASALALPRSQRELAQVMAGCALFTIGLCYFGVIAMPEVSIHQATDAVERELAGDWRGLFPHKNQAGGMMALFLYIGLFVTSAWNRLIGWTIVVASATFVFFSHSKTTIVLIPLTLLLAYLMERVRSTAVRAVVAIGLLAMLNLFTVGASWPGPIQTIVAKVSPNPTYTGRTDLWRFSVSNIMSKPIFGFGMGGFWRTSEVMYRDNTEVDPDNSDMWVTELGTDSHNSYLEAALQIGIPGLLLLLTWVIVLPLLAYPVATAPPENRTMARLFTRIWLQVLYMTALETVFLTRNNPVWFTCMIAIFGLHVLTRYRVVDGSAPADDAAASEPR